MRRARATNAALSLHAACAIVFAVATGCAAYAAAYARGLYLDGAYFLFEIAERSWFFLPAPPRATIDVLRQAPVVILARYTDAPLFRLGQALSLAMAALPVLLVAACWLIAPRERKAWVLFPTATLLIGISPAAFMPHTEASIGAAYVWVLLFLLMFRARGPLSQVAFLALCLPAFWLIEAACLMMPALLLACLARWRTSASAGERAFVAAAGIFIVAIAAYQASWVLWPRVPTDADMLRDGLRHLAFLYTDGHLNLPFVTGAAAFGALSILIVWPDARPARAVVIGFVAIALSAIGVAFLMERSFSPYAHYHARYFPILITLVLGAAAVWTATWQPSRLPMAQPAILTVLVSLSLAQGAADIAATWRWRDYTADLQQRLAASSGLISWESTVRTGDAQRDRDWRLLNHDWLMPIMSVIWSPGGIVRSMINYPAGYTWRPLDPEKPDELPKLPGIDFTPYVTAMRAGARKP